MDFWAPVLSFFSLAWVKHFQCSLLFTTALTQWVKQLLFMSLICFPMEALESMTLAHTAVISYWSTFFHPIFSPLNLTLICVKRILWIVSLFNFCALPYLWRLSVIVYCTTVKSVVSHIFCWFGPNIKCLF